MIQITGNSLFAQGGCAAALYHQAGLHEERGELDAAVRCLEQVVAIDEKYGLPKLAENRVRLARLSARTKQGHTGS